MVALGGPLLTRLGCALAVLTHWTPEGQPVSLAVTEGERGFYGSMVSGTMLHRISTEHRPSGPPGNPIGEGMLIRLDRPWRYANRTTSETEYVIVETRFVGTRFCQIVLMPVTVHVFPSSGSPPYVTAWRDMIAICDLRRYRKALNILI